MASGFGLAKVSKYCSEGKEKLWNDLQSVDHVVLYPQIVTGQNEIEIIFYLALVFFAFAQ